jgi:hypothetical protein
MKVLSPILMVARPYVEYFSQVSEELFLLVLIFLVVI